MFELSSLTPETPLAFVALAALYNILRHALTQYHERKMEKDEAATQERIINLSTQLARAEEEIKYLRAEVASLKKEKGA